MKFLALSALIAAAAAVPSPQITGFGSIGDAVAEIQVLIQTIISIPDDGSGPTYDTTTVSNLAELPTTAIITDGPMSTVTLVDVPNKTSLVVTVPVPTAGVSARSPSLPVDGLPPKVLDV